MKIFTYKTEAERIEIEKQIRREGVEEAHRKHNLMPKKDIIFKFGKVEHKIGPYPTPIVDGIINFMSAKETLDLILTYNKYIPVSLITEIEIVPHEENVE